MVWCPTVKDSEVPISKHTLPAMLVADQTVTLTCTQILAHKRWFVVSQRLQGLEVAWMLNEQLSHGVERVWSRSIRRLDLKVKTCCESVQ